MVVHRLQALMLQVQFCLEYSDLVFVLVHGSSRWQLWKSRRPYCPVSLGWRVFLSATPSGPVGALTPSEGALTPSGGTFTPSRRAQQKVVEDSQKAMARGAGGAKINIFGMGEASGGGDAAVAIAAAGRALS